MTPQVWVVEEKIHGRWYPMIGHGRKEYCTEKMNEWLKEFPQAKFRIVTYRRQP